MPQIVEYVNREGLTPTDRGTEARVQEGRRIGAAFNQVAESMRDFGNRAAQQVGSAVRDAGDAAVAWQDQRQIHQGATMGAGLFNQLTNSQNDVVNGIDPNDPAYSSKVDSALQQWRQQKLEPALDQFYQGFTTDKSKAWAEQHIDQMRQHFYTAGAAETARAASLGVKTGIQNTLTSLSNTVVQDPSAVQTSLDLWENSVRGVVGTAHGISAGDAANAQTTFLEAGRKKIVNDAAASAIQKAQDPEAEAARWVKQWPQYITGDEALKLGRAAKTQNKVNLATDRQNQRYAVEQQNDDVKRGANKVFSDNVKIDPATNKPVLNPNFFKETLELAKKFPDATDTKPIAESLLNYGYHLQQEQKQITSDPAIKDELYSRMWDTDNPTSRTQILNAAVKDELDQHDVANMLNLQKSIEDDPESSHLYREIIPSIRGLLGTDPSGAERYAKFAGAFFPTFRTLPPEQRLKALDLNDPNSLISRVLAPYRRTPSEMFIDRLSHGLVQPGEGGGITLPTPGNLPVPSGTRPGQVPPKEVKSKEDAQKLNPGTRYRTPDGQVFIR